MKSGFVLAPALFTLRLLSPLAWSKLAAVVFGFSLVASALYAFNDVCNRSEDRLHPSKKLRPVASGKLGIGSALLAGGFALVVGLGLLYFASPKAVIWGGSYALLMASYSLYLRKLMIVDLLVVSAGFDLRVLAGGAAIGEPISHWLILCTFTIALFLGLIKRRQELAALHADGGATRAVLATYPPLPILDGWIAVATAMTLICYALYTVDPQTVLKHQTHALIYTIPFVIYGVFRYTKLAVTGRAGEDPTELVIRDAGLKWVVLLWGVTVMGILWVAKKGL